MRVDRFTLENFRGVRRLTLELPSRVTVLAGINGAGKSTILAALSMMLNEFSAELRDQKDGRRAVEASDVRNGETIARVMIETSGESGQVSWGLTIERTLSRISTRPQMNQLQLVVGELRKKLQADPMSAVPVTVTYSTNRAVLDIPLRIRTKHVFDQFSAFDEQGEGGWSNFRLFFEWFREREDFENQERARRKDFVDPQLEAVRKAIHGLVPTFNDLRVSRQPLRMTVDKAGVELDVAQLSDGEKCLLAMTADLARRLAVANPSASEPLASSGIVLIDEIELHLHPQWQRMIVPSLANTFSGCQFIVTTHSPQVLSSEPREGVRLLRMTPLGVQATQPELSYGRDSNQILLELMDTPDRPEEVRESLDKLFRLIDAGEIEKARQLRKELELRIGADEPEFVRADALFRLRGLTA